MQNIADYWYSFTANCKWHYLVDTGKIANGPESGWDVTQGLFVQESFWERCIRYIILHMLRCLFTSPDVHDSAWRKGNWLNICHLKPPGHVGQPTQLSLNSFRFEYLLQISLHAFHETAHALHYYGSNLLLCNGGNFSFHFFFFFILKMMILIHWWIGNCSKALDLEWRSRVCLCIRCGIRKTEHTPKMPL